MLKYESVADDIREKIVGGTYAPNDQLPTTPELCDEYQVSKITVKKAMDELVAQGLIARRRGSGREARSRASSLPRSGSRRSLSSPA